jgi:nuclear transport factor 2 (NTF2) superfamily protein
MADKSTEKKKVSNQRWDSKNLDRVSLALPKGKKDAIKAHAEKMGESVNKFISRAIDETMERDNSSSL